MRQTQIVLSVVLAGFSMLPQGPPGVMVDVGGFKLFLSCLGEGAPAVVIDGGAGTMATTYSVLQQRLAQRTRVCVYDRAGLGRSESGPRPRTSRRMAGELHTALTRAAIAPPYVLVGHSLGGYTVRVFESMYPGEVAAIALVEAGHPGQWRRLPSAVLALLRETPAFLRGQAAAARAGKLALPPATPGLRRAVRAEFIDAHLALAASGAMLDARADEVDAAPTSATEVPAALSRDVPLVVLTARNSYAAFAHLGIPVDTSNAVWMEMQRELAALAARSQHLMSNGDHNLHENDPDAFERAVVEALRAARQKGDRRPADVGARR
jgi:pimeloyl-ACP methyl ester carboxylesterase